MRILHIPKLFDYWPNPLLLENRSLSFLLQTKALRIEARQKILTVWFN